MAERKRSLEVFIEIKHSDLLHEAFLQLVGIGQLVVGNFNYWLKPGILIPLAKSELAPIVQAKILASGFQIKSREFITQCFARRPQAIICWADNVVGKAIFRIGYVQFGLYGVDQGFCTRG